MSYGPGRWQRAVLALLDEEMKFEQIAIRLDIITWAQRSALRRALDRLVAIGLLDKRPGKRMYGGARDIVWFRVRN